MISGLYVLILFHGIRFARDTCNNIILSFSHCLSHPIRVKCILNSILKGARYLYLNYTSGRSALFMSNMTTEEKSRLKGLGFITNRNTGTFSARVITVNGRLTTAQINHIAKASASPARSSVLDLMKSSA